MNTLWKFILVVAILAASGFGSIARADSNAVYAVEYNQSTNRFGTVNLLNGNFTKIASIGSARINDIAYCPTNGLVYGISNSSALMVFNVTNGTMTKIANLSANGLESLAFRYSDGALFAATKSALYTLNPANGTATSVGNYGTPKNLNTGQNIRFAQDGNLYLSNTSTNTDIYRINTRTGAATWMGEAVGYPYLILENTSSNMYGVFINLGSGGNTPELVTFNLNGFVNGGTNANGTTNLIVPTLVGGGTNFPPNFNFSGNAPLAITNLTIPVSATGPTNQTTIVGNNVAFSTVASGTSPYVYAWSYNGTNMSGQTNSTLTLSNVTTANAGTYSVIVGGVMGTVTNSAVLTVNKASAVLTLGNLNQTYTGSAATVTATTIPNGLTVNFTYNGLATAPTNSGSYTVIGTINNSNYQGSATNTLVIGKANGSITLSGLNKIYTGSAIVPTATTMPSGMTVNFTYNGSATAPTNAGSYTVIAMINNPNYQGSATNTLVIAKTNGSVVLGNLNQTYTGSAVVPTATTTPNGMAVSFTYNGSAITPTNAGSYTVIGTINNPNYQGSATNLLIIGKANGSIVLSSLNQSYTGSALAATATTTPSGMTVNLTYNGSTLAPTNAGSYTVIGTINNSNYQGSATNTLVIAKGNGSITLGDLNQTYTGSALAATATTTPSGMTVNLTYNGSTLAPTNAGSYTVIGTINDPNYEGSATNILVIEKANGSIVLSSLNQTYTGSATVPTAATTPNGLAVNFTYNGSTTAPTNAGSYIVIGTISDANYQGSATNTLVISQAEGSIVLNNLNQTYTGSAATATATTTPEGLAVNFTYNGSATAPTNAGSYIVIGTISDANYQGSATNTLVIEQAEGSIVLNNLKQTYTGSAATVTATTTPEGLAVNFTYNGSATAPTNAGSYVVIGTISDANYQGSVTNTLVIGQAEGSIVLNNLNQTYTGSAATATATTTPSGLSVNFTYDGSSIAPTNAGNYTVIGTINDADYQGSATNTLVINKVSVTVTNLLAVDKVYDGTTNATLNALNASVIGLINGDDVSLVTSNAAAYFADKDLGTNKPVTVTNLELGSTHAANYMLLVPTNLTATITAAELTLTGIAASPKIYDSTTNAQVSGVASLTGVIGNDDVNLTTNAISMGFASPNVGTSIPVSISGYALTGTDADNYTLIQPANLAADITPATLTISATANTKIYDGSPSAAATPTAIGLKGTDTVTDLVETYDTKHAGTGKTLSVSGYTINDGNSGNNYTVNTVASTAGIITPAPLTVTADNKTMICGMAVPALTAHYSGFVNNENTNAFSSQAILNTTATSNCGAGSYPITVAGAVNSNYAIQYLNGTLKVSSAPELAVTSVIVNGTQQCIVSYPTITGQTYQLRYTTDLASIWTPLGTPVAGTDGIVTVSNNIAATQQCFFRVEVLDEQ